MGFTSILDILKNVSARYPQFGRRLKEVEALGRWDKAVGTAIARHSRALRVQEGILWVEVDHPIWKTELHHRKHQILEILNQATREANEIPGKTPIAPLKDLFLVDARKPFNP